MTSATRPHSILLWFVGREVHTELEMSWVRCEGYVLYWLFNSPLHFFSSGLQINCWARKKSGGRGQVLNLKPSLGAVGGAWAGLCSWSWREAALHCGCTLHCYGNLWTADRLPRGQAEMQSPGVATQVAWVRPRQARRRLGFHSSFPTLSGSSLTLYPLHKTRLE